MTDKNGPIPKVIYEALPYFYLAFALVAIYLSDHFLVSTVSWLIYAAGAIIFALRSDARRNNRKEWNKAKRLFNWPEDLYELIPFIALGVAVVLFKNTSEPATIAGSVLLWFYGTAVLAVRIIKREISWVHEWQRVQGQIPSRVAHVRSSVRPGRIAYCDRCVSKTECRTTGFTDKSNIAIMKWLQGSGSEETRKHLKRTLYINEERQITDDVLMANTAKLRAYQENCLAWGVRGVERRRVNKSTPLTETPGAVQD